MATSREDGTEKEIILGMVAGKTRRCQRGRWMDEVKETTQLGLADYERQCLMGQCGEGGSGESPDVGCDMTDARPPIRSALT